eukprot:gene4944-5185_t
MSESLEGSTETKYTVAFTRTRQEQVTYVLSGSIVIQDTDIIGNVITLPVVKVTPPSGVVVTVPSSDISCPALAVPAGKANLVCTFEAQYTGSLPLPGSVVASVTIAGTSRSVTSQPVQYDFSAATLAEIGGIATVSNYFEQGTGIMQPYGVSGLQPPPGMTIEDTRVFTYLALFGQVDPSKCNQQWKATPAPVAATPAPALLPVPAATPTPAAPAPAPATRPVAPVPAGITFAEAGSTICGGGACGPNQRCFAASVPGMSARRHKYVQAARSAVPKGPQPVEAELQGLAAGDVIERVPARPTSRSASFDAEQRPKRPDPFEGTWEVLSISADGLPFLDRHDVWVWNPGSSSRPAGMRGVRFDS